MKRTLIIAEVGVNHNGSINMALELIDRAAEAGVDLVKFQTFRPELLVSEHAKTAAYQFRNMHGKTDSQYEMLRNLMLAEEDHYKLLEHCKQRGVDFFSTAFDLESVAFLDKLGLNMWKIPSGEITNFPYLRAVGQTGKPVILSTGMSNIEEIRDAISVLVRFGTPAGEITLLHCTTEYPAPKEEVNLLAMKTMADHFGLPVGYSDHTSGLEISLAAVAMGATVIEKHFTLDRNLEGPDHRASLEPDEICELVSQIRNIEAAMGDGQKRPSASEIKNIGVARKSIVASRPIAPGESFSEDNLTAKRPGGGISPMLWEEVLGQKSSRDFKTDEPIEL